MSTSLYDLAPLGRMMLTGVTLALGPLAWVWLRGRSTSVGQRLAWLTGLTLFLTFDLVLFGAFTRLSDSGLGCPDWPGCYGNVSPMGARDAIAAAQLAMPSGPVTWSKAWIEMIHRYLATSVGVLIVVIALVSWRERRQLRISVFWPMLTLFWVCLQGAFGALTVTMKLFPAIVTLHLLGGFGLLSLLRLQSVAYRQAESTDATNFSHHGLLPLIWMLFVMVWVQAALGGWVSTNYAVLACTEFPACQGSWWPDMDFSGFEIWRGLGVLRSGEALTFEALTAIHYVHRLMAYLVLLTLMGLAWRMWHVGLSGPARSLLWLAAWQLATGLSNVVFEWPLMAALGHTGGAAALVVLLTGWLASAALGRNTVPIKSELNRGTSA